MKKLITTILTALIAFTIGQAQTSSSVVKMRSLMIDAHARPGIGQFVSADDDLQHLVYELFMVNWQKQNLRLA
jgi:hypothetical protein